MDEEDYDMIFKIILIGDSGVGKTNFLLRYIKNEFKQDSKCTVGVEFGTKSFEIEDDKIKAQIWDTAGQERYKSITKAYYKGAKGAIVLYDITRKTSFESAESWISSLRTFGDPDINILLIGNKSDLKDMRQVEINEGNEKAMNNSNDH